MVFNLFGSRNTFFEVQMFSRHLNSLVKNVANSVKSGRVHNTCIYRTLSIETLNTPNPNCIKVLPGPKILEPGETMDFPNVDAAQNSPLATMIFRCDGIESMFFGSDFLTLTKKEGADWKLMKLQIFATITEFFASNLPVVTVQPSGPTIIYEDDDEVVQVIKEILDTKVRPTAHEHGGDAKFVDFKDGVLRLKMFGTCTSCPNSAETLKNGILNMLRFYVPEVVDVERVDDSRKLGESSEIINDKLKTKK